MCAHDPGPHEGEGRVPTRVLEPAGGEGPLLPLGVGERIIRRVNLRATQRVGAVKARPEAYRIGRRPGKTRGCTPKCVLRVRRDAGHPA